MNDRKLKPDCNNLTVRDLRFLTSEVDRVSTSSVYDYIEVFHPELLKKLLEHATRGLQAVALDKLEGRTPGFLEPVQTDDHIMPLLEWRAAVACGAYVPDDGCGNWSNGTHRTATWSDDLWQGTPPEGTTHVVWFNK